MALRQGRLGSLNDVIQYDDTVHPTAMEVDDPIRVNAAPVNANDVLRQADMPTAGDIVTAAANITDNSVVRGDGGAKGIQGSLVSIDDAGSISLPAGQTVDGIDISVHAADASAHHAKYTDAEARASINNIFGSDGKADSDIDLDTHSIYNSKVRLTSEGGLAVRLTNKTGANSVKGQLVKADTANNDAAILTAISDNECFGVFYEDGIADGSEAWVVVSGIADVLFEDNHGPTRGDWVATSSSDAGYAVSQASPAAAPTHFTEIGHCIQTVAAGGAGTYVSARCVLHFN